LMETFAAHHGGASAVAVAKGSTKSKTIILRSVAAVAAIFILFMFLFPFGNNEAKNNLTAENKENSIEEKEKPTTEVEKTEDIKREDTIEQQSIDPIQESPVQVAANEAPSGMPSREFRLVEADATSGNTNLFGDVAHSDRLESYDLPEQSRQVVQDNPALLDVLYTAF